MQTRIQDQFGQDILNILSGQAMFNEFYDHQLMGKGDYAPFNEAMCSNDTTSAIFSDEFNRLRASGHRVPLEEYMKITVTPLQSLFEKKFKCIAVWFGDDMFCQINLLTLLAYLEQARYDGKVYFHMVNELTYDVEETEIKLGGYQEIYQQVLIQHRLPEANLLPAMYQGIRLYLEYIKEENEITAFMKKHSDEPRDELLQRLFKRFPHYGLGDTQYIKLMEAL